MIDKLKENTKYCIEECPIDMIKSITDSYNIGNDLMDNLKNTPFFEESIFNPINIDEILKEILEISKTGEFPNRFSDNFIRGSLYFRSYLVNYWGFSLINSEFIDSLYDFVKWKKCLEVMSGRGLLATLLKEKGVDTICTYNNVYGGSGTDFSYVDIEIIEAEESIIKYGKDIDYVIMSWPPLGEDSAYRVAKALRRINSNASIIYIGENRGCTADETFFNYIEDVIEIDFKKVQESYQQYIHMHDRPYLIR